jgi:hypothetical protein
MDLTGQTDDELLSRRNQAFMQLATAPGPGPRRVSAYDEIRLINRELERRRPPRAGSKKRRR